MVSLIVRRYYTSRSWIIIVWFKTYCHLPVSCHIIVSSCHMHYATSSFSNQPGIGNNWLFYKRFGQTDPGIHHRNSLVVVSASSASGGHVFDPRPRHTKVVKRVLVPPTLNTQHKMVSNRKINWRLQISIRKVSLLLSLQSAYVRRLFLSRWVTYWKLRPVRCIYTMAVMRYTYQSISQCIVTQYTKYTETFFQRVDNQEVNLLEHWGRVC